MLCSSDGMDGAEQYLTWVQMNLPSLEPAIITATKNIFMSEEFLHSGEVVDCCYCIWRWEPKATGSRHPSSSNTEVNADERSVSCDLATSNGSGSSIASFVPVEFVSWAALLEQVTNLNTGHLIHHLCVYSSPYLRSSADHLIAARRSHLLLFVAPICCFFSAPSAFRLVYSMQQA